LVKIHVLISQLLYCSVRADRGQKSSSEVQGDPLLDIVELGIIRNTGCAYLVQELSVKLHEGLIRLHVQKIICILGFLLLERLLKEPSQCCNHLVRGSELVRAASTISGLKELSSLILGSAEDVDHAGTIRREMVRVAFKFVKYAKLPALKGWILAVCEFVGVSDLGRAMVTRLLGREGGATAI
jgi:hypothetical protein